MVVVVVEVALGEVGALEEAALVAREEEALAVALEEEALVEAGAREEEALVVAQEVEAIAEAGALVGALEEVRQPVLFCGYVEDCSHHA